MDVAKKKWPNIAQNLSGRNARQCRERCVSKLALKMLRKFVCNISMLVEIKHQVAKPPQSKFEERTLDRRRR
jgi:hypothetical protein